MARRSEFIHDLRGNGRPQILLIGNGLERSCDCEDWGKLVEKMNVRNFNEDTEKAVKNLPFPLQYELLVTPENAPANFRKADIEDEEQRLAKNMVDLLKAKIDIDGQFSIFKELTTLGVDHIFTTNYSYCPEKAFLPSVSFANSGTRGKYRFNLNPEKDKNGRPKNEINYRIHSGYEVPSAGGTVGIWHIHGESSVPTGVILGHDRYGRLLSRIVSKCGGIDFDNKIKGRDRYKFRSWPELFLFGDIYVLGFGFAHCEFDLWWLLRRKQREAYGDGKVYFYEHDPISPTSINQLLLKAHGVELVTNSFSDGEKDSYKEFYKAAFEDIRVKIAEKRG